MALLASPHETANGSGGITAVRFQMILVTLHIFKKSITLRAFDRGPVRGTRGIGQTKRATMRTDSTMVFNVSISHITIITIILSLGDSRHGNDDVVMLVVV
jgi:hypothetical protein